MVSFLYACVVCAFACMFVWYMRLCVWFETDRVVLFCLDSFGVLFLCVLVCLMRLCVLLVAVV